MKICGITSLEDAELAVELGAWAIGMIFYEGSPRRCSLAEAQQITAALRRKVELCGVFVNAPLEQVVAAGEDLGLTMVQLHGDEGPAFCGEVPRRTGARVIKAAQVSGPGDVRDLERFHVDFHLLDARAQAPERRASEGRHGRDVRLGAAARAPLEGAADPQRRAHGRERRRGDRPGAPFAVDTASGTETAPGHKDPARLRAFFDGRGGGRASRAGSSSETPSRARRASNAPARAQASTPSSTASGPTAGSSCRRR